MNESLLNLIKSEIGEGIEYHQPFAPYPNSFETENFEIEFIISHGELEDISVNLKNPEWHGFEEGDCWNYSDVDFSSEIAIMLCEKINRSEWIEQLGIDYSTELDWI